MNKVVVIGVDGATFEVINPLIEVNRLSNFKKLKEEGVWGNLSSTIPPLSPPAWASFTTGKNPGKHGVFHFFTQPRGDFHCHLINSTFVKGKRFWDYLGEEGKRVGLVDLPLTYPPDRKSVV